MAASNQTIDAIVRAILRHVDAGTAKKIVSDLEKVRGNKSFAESMRRLREKLEDEH